MPSFQIPNPTGTVPIELEPGASLVLLGANGAGKTRLGVWIEQTLGANADVHRIEHQIAGAFRSLLATGGSAQMRGFATGVGPKADIGGPV